MNIFGVSLADSRNQLIAASFFGGTFISKSLFDRIVKPIVPSYEFSFLKSQTAVSLGLATYTTLKIMELAKLIPSVPLPFKIIGALSTFALMTSGLVKTMYSLKTADDLARRFNAMQQYCLSLKEQGKPFHCSIELINPQDSKPYLIHVIYQDTCKVNLSHRALIRSSVFLGLLNKRAANLGILSVFHPPLAANVLMTLSA